MNSLKCKSCGLTNFATDTECRRCGNSFIQESPKRRDGKAPRRFSVWSLLMIALVAGVFYYFYYGVQESMDSVNANEAKRVGSQPAERPLAPGLSRTQYDQQKAGTYGDAVKNSASLGAHQEHIDQTQKVVDQVSNTKPIK